MGSTTPSTATRHVLAYASPQPARNEPEPAAVGSFLCGIVLIVPLLTGVIAVILGVWCLRASPPLRFSDRMLAWIGLTLGALNVVGTPVLLFTNVFDLIRL